MKKKKVQLALLVNISVSAVPSVYSAHNGLVLGAEVELEYVGTSTNME